jgi:hypothetical protein
MHFSLVENPHSRIRHDLVPRWHFDMVLDNQRNEMYENAIQRAIRHQHAIGNKVCVPKRLFRMTSTGSAIQAMRITSIETSDKCLHSDRKSMCWTLARGLAYFL